jgi:hypothetical protein
MEQYLYFAARKASESVTGFLARYHSALSRFSQIINEHRVAESKRHHARAKAGYQRVQLEWLARKELHRADPDHHRDPGDQPEPPAERVPDNFALPEIVSGFLLLRKLGLDRKGRAELLRAARGLELPSLEQVLRSSEAEHFTRGSSGAYLAADEGDYDAGAYAMEIDDGDPQYPEEVEDFVYSYQVDPESAEAEDNYLEQLEEIAMDTSYAYLAEDCMDDEHHEAVNYDYECYVAWKDARKHLDHLRRARGFLPVARAKGKGKGKGKPRKGKGKGKSSKPSGKGKGPFRGKSFGKYRFVPRDGLASPGSLPPGAPGLPSSDGSGASSRPKGSSKGSSRDRKVAYATAEDLGLSETSQQGFAQVVSAVPGDLDSSSAAIVERF